MGHGLQHVRGWLFIQVRSPFLRALVDLVKVKT